MKVIKDILNIPSEYTDEERRKQQLEIETKIKNILEVMTMRLVLNSYTLPENLDFVVHKLKIEYNNILSIKEAYINAIKDEQYTDSILFIKESMDEHQQLFFELSKNLYFEAEKLQEVPICIRENYDLLKAEWSKLESELK